MPNSRLKRVTAEYRAKLLRADSAARDVLQAAYQQSMQSVNAHLDILSGQIQTQLDAGEDVPLSWLYDQHRLETFQQLATGQLNHYGALARQVTGSLQTTAVRLGSDLAQEQLKATVPPGVSFSFGVPLPSAIHDIVAANQPGSPLYDLFNSFGSQASKEASRALITGVSLGQSPREYASAIKEALDVPRWRALTIARTSGIGAYRSAQMANFRANDDVVEGWIWICALLPSSCAACIAMHGTEHSLDEELDDHPNGTCTAAPKTKSWEDILGPLGIDTSDLEDTSPDIEGGSDWFDKQSEDTQRSILGNAKYNAYQDGTFDLSDVVGHTDDKEWGSSIYEKPLKALT